MGAGQNSLDKLVALTLRVIFRINGSLEVTGIENIPAEGGVLVAANHISYLDPLAIGSVIPRKPTFMARKGLFDIPVIKYFIRHFSFPVDREKTRPSTIKEAVRRLKSGELVIMFPEGRRSDSGELMEAKRGVGMVANLSKVAIVPAMIAGSEKALPVDARWLKRAKISIAFGKPIYYNLSHDKESADRHSIRDEISNVIMSDIKALQQRYESGTL
jgi:1-acyl-sn-glycerol-3-phosphate acyltransferase